MEDRATGTVAGHEVKCVLPITVRIGVTGHRSLGDEEEIKKSVRKVLARISEILGGTPHSFVAVSPLAEGADRLVAKEILATQQNSLDARGLTVPLPMPVEVYVQDFASGESKAEFRELLALANRSLELEADAKKFEREPNDSAETENLKKDNRRQAFRRVGLWVVDECDVVIAIWNGDKAKGVGGTAEIVEYARRIHRSLAWIDSQTGEIKDEKYDQRLLKAFEHHIAFNAENLSAKQIASESERRFAKLTEQAEKTGLDRNVIEELRQTLLPDFVRATMLAARYQKFYLNAGTWVYILAATSVATVTVAAVLQTNRLIKDAGERLIWLEVVQIGIIMLLLALSGFRGWHRKWIDYRFLAERLRAAMFLFVAGIACDPPLALGHQGVSDEWMVGAFKSICSACPKPGNLPKLIAPVKDFLLLGWISGQQKFYSAKSKEHEFRYRWLEISGYFVFGLTAVAAIWHAYPHTPDFLRNPLASVAIILPATGASLAGIRTYREHLRNAKRYESMDRYLTGVIARIQMETNPAWLGSILHEANEVMMREHEDWRVVMLPDIKP